jgi:hypothetical protein
VPDELNPDEMLEALQRPHTIWAPDGTTFVASMVISEDGGPFDKGLIRYEVRGPDASDHLWLATDEGDLLANPADDDVPRDWTVKARFALSGWLELVNELNG